MPSVVFPEPYTLLRIKRKRTEEPVAALVYDLEPPSPTRERNMKRAKTGGDAKESGVFRFAETVDKTTWEASKSGQGALDLRSRITCLMESQPVPPSVPTAARPQLPVDEAADASSVDVFNQSAMDVDPPRRVYRIIPGRPSMTARPGKGSGKVPVIDGEMEEDGPAFNLYEAELVPPVPVISSVSLPSSYSSSPRPVKDLPANKRLRKAPKAVNVGTSSQDEEDTDPMAAFADMLTKYLKVNEGVVADVSPLKRPLRAAGPLLTSAGRAQEHTASSLSVDGSTLQLKYRFGDERPKNGGASASPSPRAPTKDVSMDAVGDEERADAKTAEPVAVGKEANSDDEFVYDLFYYSSKEGDARMMKMLNQGHVAALTGRLTNDQAGHPDSEGEVDSEVDEDSNDEGYYRNDYPDEDDDLSDDDRGVNHRHEEDGEFWDDNDYSEEDFDCHDADDDEDRMMF